MGLFLAACAAPQGGPGTPDRAPLTESHLYLAKNGPSAAGQVFELPSAPSRGARVVLVSQAARPVSAALRCDGPVRLQLGGEGHHVRAGARRIFTLPHKRAQPAELMLPPGVNQCLLEWGEGHRIELARAARVAPRVAAMDRAAQACPPPPAAGGDALAAAFFATRDLSQTCPMPTGAFRLLPGEVDSLKYRIDKLTGGNISAARLTSGDPDMPLDFANAPHFDEIVLSHLLIRADMAGYLVSRALAFHAARGTRVRIMTTGGLTRPFDRRLYEALAAQYPNVQLQYYRYPARSPGDIVASLQRSNHVKLFLGLSPEPGRSFAIMGGRNLSDGFHLEGRANYPDHPFLHSYGLEADGFEGLVFHSIYDDFDLALTGDAQVARLAQHFAKYWWRDGPTQALAPGGAAAAGPAAGAGGQMRHFLSLPFADGQAQEALFVDLFDAARREIAVISPFNYPPPAIEAALQRAAARGVQVRIITRRGGDEPPAAGTRALNAQFLEDNHDRYEMRVYARTERLLHAKIIVIDGRLGMVTSTNLNFRSFVHDTENGIMFLDRAVAAGLLAEFERFWVTGEDIETFDHIRVLRRVFDALPGILQFF